MPTRGLVVTAQPVLGLLVVLALLGVSRLIWSRPRPRHPAACAPAASRDFGLLAPVSWHTDLAGAQAARQVLADTGLRATLTPVGPHGPPVRASEGGPATVVVLVFRTDTERALAVLAAGG